MPAPRTRRFQTGAGTLNEQFALELGEAGENRKDQPAVGSRGVDRRAFARQHFEADAAFREVADRVDEVAEIAAEPVELPYDQRVITAQRFQAGIETGPLVEPTRRGVLIDMLGSTPAATSASRWRSWTWLPSALDTRA